MFTQLIFYSLFKESRSACEYRQHTRLSAGDAEVPFMLLGKELEGEVR